LAAGLDSNHLTVYRIDPETGALDPRKRYPMGQQPNWIEFADLR
jgi:6-phosphogluconolactonase